MLNILKAISYIGSKLFILFTAVYDIYLRILMNIVPAYALFLRLLLL